jgi:CheY-like chemotaxis protein
MAPRLNSLRAPVESPHGDRKSFMGGSEEARAPRPPNSWPELAGIHVFLIEDNSDTRTMVSEVLIHCGAMVTVYQSADQALVDLGEFVPTMFICDLSMPGLDGLGFMRRMRTLPIERGSRIPAIAITAYYEDFAAAAALEAGFNAYMTKPIRLDELARLVSDLARTAPPDR